jgi:hypothetical protein
MSRKGPFWRSWSDFFAVLLAGVLCNDSTGIILVVWFVGVGEMGKNIL